MGKWYICYSKFDCLKSYSGIGKWYIYNSTFDCLKSYSGIGKWQQWKQLGRRRRGFWFRRNWNEN